MRKTMTLVMSAMLVFRVAHADGGAICLRESSGAFLVTVFIAPQPLQAGPIDASVLVQDRETGAVILDAQVGIALLRLDDRGQRVLRRATRERATNKLLQSGRFELSAGAWALQLVVSRGRQEATFATTLQVAAAAPRLAAIWPLLLMPPCAIVLFVLHQGIRRPALLTGAQNKRRP